jgi:hypothetical protein
MTTFATTLGTPQLDGLLYANAAVLPAVEADLGNGAGSLAPPLSVQYARAVTAEIQLTIAGGPASNTTYIVLQTDFGDGNWIDLAWLKTTSTSNGTTTWLLTGGQWSANALQQSRASGTPPGPTGSNALPLGGRIRFTGQAALTGGSSPTVSATIRAKLHGLN